SSHVDRFMFINNSKLNIESLIKNLKNMIMKKLSVIYITESSISLSILSVSLSATSSQSSTLISVSDSLTLTTSVLTTCTSATSAFATSTSSVSAASAIVISSFYFKKILHRLSESYFLRIISLFNSVKSMKNICVFRNRNVNIVLFYIYECETYTPFTLMSEIMLIEDDNTAETIFFCSQASLITFSLFSVKKIVHISDYKHS
ncbi:hypothetical protein BDBG_16255, partial [Blastomyces gilchristii SLH14081]